MTTLNILKYPDPRLYKVASEVKIVDSKIKTLISAMAKTMYEAPGIGLAATQVDIHQRIIVIDISEDKDDLLVLINPVLLEKKERKLIRKVAYLYLKFLKKLKGLNGSKYLL